MRNLTEKQIETIKTLAEFEGHYISASEPKVFHVIKENKVSYQVSGYSFYLRSLDSLARICRDLSKTTDTREVSSLFSDVASCSHRCVAACLELISHKLAELINENKKQEN